VSAKLSIIELSSRGDGRGMSFTAPVEVLAFLTNVADVHLAATKPGAVRGNHYHLRRREAIVVLPGSSWSLHWDDGEGSSAQSRVFEGETAILVTVPPGSSHAVRNDGRCTLWLIAFSSEPYDPAETVARKVV
jgi:dTDP-4-dehydrorhamnose 3,5-epimerase-like enzyme